MEGPNPRTLKSAGLGVGRGEMPIEPGELVLSEIALGLASR